MNPNRNFLMKIYKEDIMSSKLISNNLREEIARELGVYEQVKQDGGSWANVSSKDCGNIVKKAIEIANRSVESKQEKKGLGGFPSKFCLLDLEFFYI